MHRSRPRTVQIFLSDGNARSLRIAAVTSRTVQAIQIPRAQLKAAASQKEVRRMGVYFLVGTPEEDAGKPFVYVGEAGDCLSRLQEHHRSPLELTA